MGMKFYTNVTDRNIEGGNNVRSIYPTLDKAMNEKGMTYTELATALSISQMGMYRRLRGFTQFKLTEAIQICRLFPGYSATELFCSV